MKTLLLKTLVIALLLLGGGGAASAQGSSEYGSGLKITLNPEGSKYVRLILWNQIWTRYNWNNPGTLVNGEARNTTWDVGARRLRALAYAQISPRYLVLAHVGINNQTFATGGAAGATGTGPYGAGKKPGIFFHDVWNEYAVIPSINPKTKEANKYNLYMGAGLHYWWGISRMSSASTLNFLAIDAPVINWPLVEFSDQFVRQYGIYAKGKLGKLNYSASVNKPFATNATPVYDSLLGPQAVDNNGDPSPAVQAYFDYQFLDQEANVLPFRVGSYVGTKKVFNIGAGFYHQANGTRSLNAAGETQNHAITLLGADVFADLPIGNKEKNMAITAYGVYYNYNFGPKYVRTIGIMNPASGFNPDVAAADRSIQGFGNARYFVGTGQILYVQAGLLLPKGKSNKFRLQPFGAYTYKQFEYLDEPGSYFDFGANLYLDGHHAKLTPQYSIRPLYFLRNGERVVDGSRGELLLQFQVYL